MPLQKLPVVVTGGAGYVGSAVAHALQRAGADVTIVDSLVKGHAELAKGLPLEKIDVRDTAKLKELFQKRKIRAICHLAGLATIPDSYKSPDEYRDVNVEGTRRLLEAAKSAGVSRFVFASTCAIYAPKSEPLVEGDPEAPDSPYAKNKHDAEAAVRAATTGDFKSVSLRFFNAAGADRTAEVGEMHDPETHAIPLLARWAMGRGTFTIFGNDYRTKDGTCIRDYVHVVDIADAHVKALEAFEAGRPVDAVINLGSGVGTSVRELVDFALRAAPKLKPPPVGPRRPGDAPVLVASNERARRVLGWRPGEGIGGIFADALDWEAR